MRSRPAIAPLLASICLLCAACGEALSPAPIAVGQVFVLVSVNDSELPHRIWEDAHSVYELVADTLVFRDADSVAYHSTYSWVTDDDHSLSSETHPRAYAQLPSGRLLITEHCPMAASWCREDYEERGLFRGDSLFTSIDNIDITEDRVYVIVR